VDQQAPRPNGGASAISPLTCLTEVDRFRADITSDIAQTLAYLPGSTHKLDIAHISWAGPNVAVADGEAIISNLEDPTTGDPLPPLTAKFTSVSTREHGQWLIAYLVGYTFLQPSGTN
jgi:hypothetical protein